MLTYYSQQTHQIYSAAGAGAQWYRHLPCIDSGMYYEWYILNDIFSELQRMVMDISAVIASPPTTKSIVKRVYDKEDPPNFFIQQEVLTNLETLTNRMDSLCPKITQFTIPGGGGKLSSWIDVVRTATREAERDYVEFIKGVLDKDLPAPTYPQYYNNWVENNKLCLKIINRLSDFLFIVKRFVTMTLNEDEDLYKISDKQK